MADASRGDGHVPERNECDGPSSVDGATALPTSSSFRKFRHLLMAKKFETHDNVPVRAVLIFFSHREKNLGHLHRCVNS